MRLNNDEHVLGNLFEKVGNLWTLKNKHYAKNIEQGLLCCTALIKIDQIHFKIYSDIEGVEIFLPLALYEVDF